MARASAQHLVLVGCAARAVALDALLPQLGVGLAEGAPVARVVDGRGWLEAKDVVQEGVVCQVRLHMGSQELRSERWFMLWSSTRVDCSGQFEVDDVVQEGVASKVCLCTQSVRMG